MTDSVHKVATVAKEKLKYVFAIMGVLWTMNII